MNQHTPPESVLALLKKVKALADSGTTGERANARDRLAALLKKHDISESMLLDDHRSWCRFRTRGKLDLLLVLTVIARVANERTIPPARQRGTLLAVELTTAQAVDAEAQIYFYRKLWLKEQNLFFRAFIFAQDLHLAGDGKPPDLDEEQQRDAKRAATWQAFIDAPSFRRQLEGARR